MDTNDLTDEVPSKPDLRPVLISMGLFFIACVAPALVLRLGHHQTNGMWVNGGGQRSLSGFYLMLVGILVGWLRLNFTAFANFPLWLSWILYGRGHVSGARVSAGIALLMSVETLQLLTQPFLFDEGGTVEGYLAAPHVGFFCWVGSMSVILAGPYFVKRRR